MNVITISYNSYCDENRTKDKNTNNDILIKTQVYKLEKPKRLYQGNNTRTSK